MMRELALAALAQKKTLRRRRRARALPLLIERPPYLVDDIGSDVPRQDLRSGWLGRSELGGGVVAIWAGQCHKKTLYVLAVIA